MNLTKVQLRSLKLLLKQRSKPLTTTDFVRESWRQYAFALAAVGVGIAASILIGYTAVALLLGGYILGVVERDFQWIGSYKQVAPLTSEITKWERVEQLVQENEPQKA